MKKKWLIIGSFLLFIAFSFISCGALLNWLDEPMNPTVPEKSSQGKVTLTSRGCCFWATNVTVSLLDKNEAKTVLISEETVYEYDIFDCDAIPDIQTPIRVMIDFTSHYSIEEDVSLIVGEFPNTDELLKDGLLLYFSDGGLIVRNGNKETSFWAGVFGNGGEESPWFQEQ